MSDMLAVTPTETILDELNEGEARSRLVIHDDIPGLKLDSTGKPLQAPVAPTRLRWRYLQDRNFPIEVRFLDARFVILFGWFLYSQSYGETGFCPEPWVCEAWLASKLEFSV